MRQDQALYLMGQGKSVFLTGPAGSGKTYVLGQFIKQAKRRKKQVAVTASTGIAATHLGGTTIHSWSGLGIREELTPGELKRLANNSRLQKRYNACDVLVIDEISMLHGRRLDMINEACKALRASDEPFGGLQVILTGDLFQLPPVNRSTTLTTGREGDDDFAHTSAAWRELSPLICYLSENYRQKGGELLDLLEAMRARDLRRKHINYLQSRLDLTPPKSTVLTRLYAHNVDVEKINREHLDKLPGPPRVYEMTTKGRKRDIEQLTKSVLAPERLMLKKDAEVMFVANNFAEGFANGTRGRVVDFEEDDSPIVQLQNSQRRVKAEPHSWTRTEDGRERANVSQLPLRLAWAITIHKSQGMSLDSALVDLSQSFTYGMGYVALSRVRSLDCLYLSGLNAMALKLHPDIYEFDGRLRAESLKLAEEIGEVVIEDEKENNPEEIDDYDQQLFKHLRDWRTKRASADQMPPYIIAHDKTLQEIARRAPKNNQQLMAVNGFGPKKLKTYGPEILQLVTNHKPTG